MFFRGFAATIAMKSTTETIPKIKVAAIRSSLTYFAVTEAETLPIWAAP